MASLGARSEPLLTPVVEARWASLTECMSTIGGPTHSSNDASGPVAGPASGLVADRLRASTVAKAPVTVDRAQFSAGL
jgi:hypothetical protein